MAPAIAPAIVLAIAPAIAPQLRPARRAVAYSKKKREPPTTEVEQGAAGVVNQVQTEPVDTVETNDPEAAVGTAPTMKREH
ncbi:hypothetical protein EDC01DRAFT_762362 [Geopyxis carbonaria]|nr:hypothetical protein EDC01DRAFT_762362 [Geopyxis carbonaria]